MSEFLVIGQLLYSTHNKLFLEDGFCRLRSTFPPPSSFPPFCRSFESSELFTIVTTAVVCPSITCARTYVLLETWFPLVDYPAPDCCPSMFLRPYFASHCGVPILSIRLIEEYVDKRRMLFVVVSR